MATIEAVLGTGDKDAADDVAELLRKIGEDASAAREHAERANKRLDELNGSVGELKTASQRHDQTLYGPTGRSGLVGTVEDLQGRPPPGMVTTRTLISAIAGVAIVFGTVAAIVGLS